ncbi:uncharacterized protein LOC131669300 [Phymastichus coffea]|uniref:uncharacterized protein LOC131669300 n=1 Tax=Phymastichus coffea TaxID=108790 RepID=UPI00273BCB9C|nr:uncharacterized protein LOC131669300 [Phymastichus coffea]
MEGGGVALYIRDSFFVRIIAKSHPDDYNASEFLVMELRQQHAKLLLAVVYRRPSALAPLNFFQTIVPLLPNYHDVIICGDFNCNLLSHTLHYVNVLREQIERYALKVVSMLPTCHRFQDGHASHTLLDLFLNKNDTDIHSFSKTPAPFIDCHDLIELSIYSTVPPSATKTILIRKLKSVDIVQLNLLVAESVAVQYPSPQTTLTDPTQMSLDSLERFLSNAVLKAFDTLAPVRQTKLSAKAKPWVSADIRILMRARTAAYKRAKITALPGDIRRYKDLRNRVSNLLDTAKNNHISAKLASATDPKTKWRELRCLGIAQKSMPSPLSFFSPTALNCHFAKIVNQLPPITLSCYDNLTSIPLSRSFSFPQFNLNPVSVKDVEDVLADAHSKSKGEDEISLRMLSMVSQTVLPYYTTLFNHSIANSLFPTLWKRTQIVPLSKVKSLTSLSDTRPIAKLCEPSKLFERLVHRQLSAYLQQHHLLDFRQAGFRRGHSTETALLGLLDDVRFATENRLLTIIYADDTQIYVHCSPRDIERGIVEASEMHKRWLIGPWAMALISTLLIRRL